MPATSNPLRQNKTGQLIRYGGAAVVACLAYRCASLEEQLGGLEVSILARDEQRRGAIAAGLVGRCASVAQQPGDLEVALLARDVQRCDAVLLGLNPSSC